MSWVLRLACLHCGIWGLFIVLFPAQSARIYGFLDALTDVPLWKGTGLVILLYGIGYGIASLDPLQHWAVVAIGLLSKILGTLGMVWSAWQGDVPYTVLYLLPLNDVIWWWPFAIIVRRGIHHDLRRRQDRSAESSAA